MKNLKKIDIPTHYAGLVENNTVKKLSEIKKPTNTMEIKLLHVISPGLKSDQFEVIYRNFLPPGSSVFNRLKDGEITPRDLGLDSEPHPNQKLDTPILDVSTKLEITDRYLTWTEAQQISGLSDNEIIKLKNLTNRVNDLITEEFSKTGPINEDGKIEVGFGSERRLTLVDVLGTLDECRFTLNGFPVSKEIARIYYRNTAWCEAVEDVKKKDRQRWKSICRLNPEPLPSGLKLLISQIYWACTNEITEHEWFKDVPPVKEILKELRAVLPS